MRKLKNRYEIKHMFDQGGMSKIYKAHDLFLEKTVAVKEIFIPEEEKEFEIELRKRIAREYKFLSSVNHKNIIEAYDFFEENGILFLILEFVRGDALDKVLAFRKDNLSLKEKVNVALQIVDGIKTINDAGIVHRDIKPGNIIIKEDTVCPKILDLGIGKSMEAENFTQLTVEGCVLGTVDYMSPEQLRGDVDIKSDVFSLGTTLYQFFAWNDYSPFYHEDMMEVVQKIFYYEVPLLVALFSKETMEQYEDECQAISAIISGMLIKEPIVRSSLEGVMESLCCVYQKL